MRANITRSAGNKKPVSAPEEPITRWQGMTMAIGLEPFANPTALLALGRPIRLASAP